MMTEPPSIEQALYSLIHSRSFRARFLDGELVDELDGDTLAALDSIDRGELIRTARKVVHNLIRGNDGGSSGLAGSFPRTTGWLARAGFELPELVMDFMETRWFDAYREIPTPEPGLCIEEAFYGYLVSRHDLVRGTSLAALAGHELHIALLSMLVVNPEPAFLIGSAALRRNGACRYAVRWIPESLLTETGPGGAGEPAELPYLYAATRRKLVHGPVFPLAIELLELGSMSVVAEHVETLAERHECPPDEIVEVCERLTSMELLER